ncbi:alpha/beta hydrolase [Cohnella terricola]|uniref:Alpha/beta hydrolase n=1 Tax=Cohnella terricola TaxID=1289167 RepID=A0A559JH43_9BACL|nr:alpha/beta hydrolase [Cohnella terricola]TVX99193.1 alpha/beta hydrolase [Cohnella terricola]
MAEASPRVSSPVTANEVVLEPEAKKVTEETSNPPYLYDLGPQKGREQLNKTQAGPVKMLPADIQNVTIKSGPTGKVPLTIVRPTQAKGDLPVVLYSHGGGWVLGNFGTHERLVRELAVRSNSVVVFVNYSLSPEAKYPTALEEIYAALRWVADNGRKYGIDSKKIIVAGDSVGGNMTTAVAILAKERGGPKIAKQLMFYPVTDASFDTPSYKQFAEGYYLRRDVMQWFWDQYTMDPKQRAQITASPLRATTEQLRDLPPAMIITGQADVLRDEGEAYANKLRQAGIRVAQARMQGTIHDFVMLNSLADTAAVRSAMALAVAFIRCEI